MQSWYEEKLYEFEFFELCSKKMELMKEIHLFRKGFMIFLKGAGYVFGFCWQWTMKLHTLRYSNPLSTILEDFFSIRFKPHQVVSGMFLVAKVYGFDFFIAKKEIHQLPYYLYQFLKKLIFSYLCIIGNNYNSNHTMARMCLKVCSKDRFLNTKLRRLRPDLFVGAIRILRDFVSNPCKTLRILLRYWKSCNHFFIQLFRQRIRRRIRFPR